MMLCSSVSAILFLSTPSARRATAAKGQGNIHVQISIHALREEGDQDTETGEIYKGDFYPRPPRGGRRDSETNGSKTIKFLSTPSARRATRSPAPDAPAAVFLSTPSARRATDSWCRTSQRGTISIHALREEGDRQPCRQSMRWNDFYPRPPRGGRPKYGAWATSS